MARDIMIAEIAKRLIDQGFGNDEAWRRARLLDETTREACRIDQLPSAPDWQSDED
jgi:hypothetical protein